MLFGDRPMLVDSDFAGRQILGQRDEQQDSYGFSVVSQGSKEHEAKILLVAVADGMGGHEGGREASATALAAFVEAYFGYLDAPRLSIGSSGEGLSSDDKDYFSCCALAAALGAANGALDNLVERNHEKLEGAGTTFLGVVVGRRRLQWISVGDSPLVLWRKGELKRLNADHSMRAVLAQKIAAGQMLPGDLASHPERNVLRSALLGGRVEAIDGPEESTTLQEGDVLLAATDGLLTLEQAEVCAIIGRFRHKPALFLAQRLLKVVEEKRAAKQDNATVAVVKIR